MDDGDRHTSLASSAPAWSTRSADLTPAVEEETCAETDDPPESNPRQPRATACDFQKTSIRKPGDGSLSLLTKALLNQFEDDAVPDSRPSILSRQRRRSMASNISMASTADLTSDTGLTSPSRDNTPSPPLPEMRALYIHDPPSRSPRLRFGHLPTRPRQDILEDIPRKKGITFACHAKPENPSSETTSSSSPPHRSSTTTAAKSEFPRKSCIKFACPPPRSSSDSGGPGQAVNESSTSSAIRRHRSPRPPIFRRPLKEPQQPTVNGGTRPQGAPQGRLDEPKYDEPKEDDWIREEDMSPKQRITIDDTLVKENHIRRLAKEAEEEDDDEGEDDDDGEGVDEDDEDDEDEDDEDDEDGDDDDDDEDDDDDGDDDGDFTEYGSVEADDGYHTDEETGFAESEDEEDGLNLWNNGVQPPVESSEPGGLVPCPGPQRRLSATDHHSDSSTVAGQGADKRRKPRHIFNRPVTPELPDSTDFVCGTFDEDRPMEEAYLLRRAAFEARRVHLIPQDIDPSFPTSDVEDGDEELFNPVHEENEDEMWEMEDVHGDRDPTSRKKTKGVSPPKRYHSPPPKPRGRSPRLVDKHSPRRMRSPRPKRFPSAGASPTYGVRVQCGGAGPGAGPGVGLTQTKSLPRPAAMLTLIRHGKKPRVPSSANHVRGAIDIVRGLEHKRQRRKEKFYQKYCNRARKGQIPERKALPGMGATKMRELGLLMAGKTDRGNYVMSI